LAVGWGTWVGQVADAAAWLYQATMLLKRAHQRAIVGLVPYPNIFCSLYESQSTALSVNAILRIMSGTPPRSLKVRHFVLPGLLVMGAAWFIGNGRRPVGNPHVPEPFRPVDLERYLGGWYEIGRYDTKFEHGCEGVTADYSFRSDRMIRVLNTCRIGSPTGRARSIEGKAVIVQGSGNAKLKVFFFGSLFTGHYWILDHADDYSWSIVGEPTGKYLWLLSRIPSPSDEIKERLIARASELGYDTDMIRMTRQPP
jgi:apolipoprotein D and lipocalin family protein